MLITFHVLTKSRNMCQFTLSLSLYHHTNTHSWLIRLKFLNFYLQLSHEPVDRVWHRSQGKSQLRRSTEAYVVLHNQICCHLNYLLLETRFQTECQRPFQGQILSKSGHLTAVRGTCLTSHFVNFLCDRRQCDHKS